MTDEPPVLIVDDDDGVRRVFRRVLERDGLRVHEAIDGESGIARCRELSPGMVFLDLRMPGMDGLDVLSALVAEHPETPVVVVSGQGTMDDAVQALRRGAWDFVGKPLADNELLIRAARRGVERSQLLRQNREYGESLRRTNQRLTAALRELRNDEQAARQLQFQLLPPDGCHIAPLICHRRLFPSQLLSGDFLDYFQITERYAGIYLADVAGHGAASAFVTAILTTLVGKYRELLLSRGDETLLHPQQFLTSLDADLASLSIAKHVTMFYAVVELSSGKLVYCNAGAFPFPFVVNGSEVLELESSGRPLNLPGRGRFGTGEAELGPGARMLLVSDGVLELAPKKTQRARRDEIAELLKSAHTIEDFTRPLGLSESTALSDDIAIVFVKREDAS
ncbi:MAG: PP2C family protein-serine/threonine phosphatase [Myxococcota bacterium]